MRNSLFSDFGLPSLFARPTTLQLPVTVIRKNPRLSGYQGTLLVTALMARVGDTPPDMMQSILRDSDSRL